MASQRFFLIFTACLLSIFILSGGSAQAENPPSFALKWGTQGIADGQFNRPRGLATDSSGNLYVADTENHRIEKFSSAGAFISQWGIQGIGNGQFSRPYGVAVDSSGNLYVADTDNHRIQKFSSAGVYITQWGTFGNADGQFSSPYSVTTDSADNIYIADTYNNSIQKFSNVGTFIAKWGGISGSGDGQFSMPFGVIADKSGNIFVADTGNHRIQKLSNTGTFIAKWGDSTAFNSPSGLATDGAGNVFVTDKDNNQIKKFDTAGNLLVTWGSRGSADGQFIFPWGIAADNSGNIFVSDTENHRIEKFTPSVSQTRIIWVSGDMALGNVQIGSTAQKTLTISNTGNSALTVSSITYPAGFSGSWIGVIAAGSSQSIIVTFAPTAAQSYTGTLTVNSDKTDGVNTLPVSGTGMSSQTGFSVIRNLSCYLAGNKLTISLVVKPLAATGNYGIEDMPPAGWSVANISSSGIYDSLKNKVKFGPFFDNAERTLTYDVTPPVSETSDKSFNGTASSDGANIPIGGNYVSSRCLNHPADLTPMDFSLSISELTAYGAAWKSGANWTVPPNPIPVEYVSRAGALWKGGETYKFDSTAGGAPLCWVNTYMAARSLRSQESSATRQLTSTADNTFTVSISVSPAETVPMYVVEDQLPAGWDVFNVSDHGQFDAKSNKVRFGLFMDNQPRTLSYQVKSLSGATDAPVFSGIASFNGVNVRINSLRDDMPGNIDGKAGVTLSDAVLALKILAGMTPENVVTGGDVNKDNKIGLEEAIYILQTVAGLR